MIITKLQKSFNMTHCIIDGNHDFHKNDSIDDTDYSNIINIYREDNYDKMY